MKAFSQTARFLICVLAGLFWHHVGMAGEIGEKESQKSQEIRVFANALKYFSGVGKEAEGYQVGVIYSPGIASSRAEAEEYVAEMNRSTDAKKARLRARLITVAELKSSGVNIAYLGPSLSVLYPELYPTARALRTFVYGHDAECVWQKLCPLSIKIDTTLEIFLSEAAIKDFGFEVDPMLRLMVKRLER